MQDITKKIEAVTLVL